MCPDPNFADEEFTVDLTEGDLEDSWNGVTTKTGQVYDFNFSWQENEEPAMSLYKVKEDNSTDFFDSESIKIIAQIGNFKD